MKCSKCNRLMIPIIKTIARGFRSYDKTVGHKCSNHRCENYLKSISQQVLRRMNDIAELEEKLKG